VGKSVLNAMTFRCIGPSRGGRVVAVAGDPTNPPVSYFGAAAGGIWKTEDAGTTWRNISDGYLKTSAVGALAVSDSDPSVIYAGMGESTIRLDVSHGDGVYRSGDGGQTWTHCGLSDTRHIGEIRIHPKDPDLVYVAALGHAFGPNEQRGVFRSRDGGKTWDNVLHKSDKAGAVDLAFDPRTPDVVYATMWEAHRNFWELSSGGPDSGIWKSTDGGDTWTDITRNQGLPQTGIIGKVGVAASPVKAGRVWALVESSEDPGLYRSEDFGDTWQLLSDNHDLRYRPWYYMHVFADTQDADTVYVNNLMMWRSNDGGNTFTKIGTPHGDNHDLWIDPANNQHMVQGNDGGANVSFNAGASWSTIYNQLTAQFYTVTTDTREPFYYVYGTQQDNSSIAVPSRTNDDAIVWSDGYPAGTGESGYMAVHPDNPDIVYVGAVGSSPGGGGALQRYDHNSGQIQLINVWPADHEGIGPGELTYRFPWTFPVLFSPHDPGILYTAGNVVFRSIDEGHSWEPISPDLTRNDPAKLGPSGGPITKDTSGAEHYCTVYTLRESAHEQGVFWAGSDDGLVHVSRDNGATWDDVTPSDLPEWSFIRTVEPSPHDAGTVYLAATRYKSDDNTPYLYKTTDYGQTWHSIVGTGERAIPEEDFVRVIRTDPERAGMLYVGTETGLYVSLDDGVSWDRWQSNLPVTPIYDLTVKGSDLVVATHGRSFWILDDLTPLREIDGPSGDDDVRLFKPRETWRILPDLFHAWTSSEGTDYMIGLGKAAMFTAGRNETGHVERKIVGAGQSAPLGVTVSYYLSEEMAAAGNGAMDASLAFLDERGDLIREFHPKPDNYDKLEDDEKAYAPNLWILTNPGVNRFLWDLRFAGSTKVLGNKRAGDANLGPLVVPGTYQVRLRLTGSNGEERTLTEAFEVVNDPRAAASQQDLEEQLEVLLRIHDKISEAHAGVNRIRAVKAQVKHWQEKLATNAGNHGDVTAAAGALDGKLGAIENELIVPGRHKYASEPNEPARLNENLASLISVVGSADARPTKQAVELVEIYSSQIDDQLEQLQAVMAADVGDFNALAEATNLPAVQ
jgi:photosystem II stability/assembly factor-like uncharacterized protein